MPDRLSPVFVPFAQGLDTRSAAPVAQAPYLLEAQNITFRRDVGPEKRTGHHALPRDIEGGGRLLAPKGLTTCGDELLCVDGGELLALAPDVGRWQRRGPLPPLGVDIGRLLPTAYPIVQAETAAHAGLGLEAAVYIDGRSTTDVRLSVRELSSGTWLTTDTLVASGRQNPRLVSLPDGLVMLYVGGTTLYARTLLPTGGVGMEIAVATDVRDAASFDVCADASLGAAVVAYLEVTVSGDGGGKLVCVGSTGAPLGPAYRVDLGAVPFAIYATTLIAVHSAGSGTYPIHVAITYSGPSLPGALVRGVSLDPAAPAGPVVTYDPHDAPNLTTPFARILPQTDVDGEGYTLFAVTPIAQGGAGSVLRYDTRRLRGRRLDIAPGPLPALMGLGLAARPFMLGGRAVYLCVSQAVSTLDGVTAPVDAAYYLIDADSQDILGRLAYGTALQALPANPPAVFVGFDGEARIGVLQKTQLRSDFGKAVLQLGASLVRLSPDSALPSATSQGTTYFASGAVFAYDGAQLTEAGFFHAPILSGTTTSGTPPTSGDAYLMVLVYEWYDAQGRLHRSAPSTPRYGGQFVFNATNFLYVQPLTLTNKTGVTLAIYVTLANGTVYHRASSYAAPIAATTGIIYGTGITEAQLAAGDILYTSFGELENDAPPASDVMAAGRGRVMVAGGEYPDTVTYSKQDVPGAGLGWSLALQKRIATVPGRIVALAQMDDKWIVFKTGGIVFFVGVGVTNGGVAAGVNDDFSEPQIITTEITAKSARGIVRTQDGIFFDSTRGIQLLTRNLQVVDIGAPVARFRDRDVASAVCTTQDGAVRFALSAGDEALVYHPRRTAPYPDVGPIGAWTTYTRHAARSACLHQGRYVQAQGGTLMCDDDGYTDDGAPIALRVTTAWLSGQGPLQFARFGALALIGECGAPHTLSIDVRTAYAPGVVRRLSLDSAALTASPAWDLPGGWGSGPWGDDALGVYVFRVRELPAQIPSTGAMQWTFADAGATLGPLSLVGMAVLIEPLGELPRLSAQKSL